MTLAEFEETLSEGWEIDFKVGDTNYHYQRSGKDGIFQLYLTSERETLYEVETDDMETAVDELMSLHIYDNKTIGQLEHEITVLSSS